MAKKVIQLVILETNVKCIYQRMYFDILFCYHCIFQSCFIVFIIIVIATIDIIKITLTIVINVTLLYLKSSNRHR